MYFIFCLKGIEPSMMSCKHLFSQVFCEDILDPQFFLLDPKKKNIGPPK